MLIVAIVDVVKALLFVSILFLWSSKSISLDGFSKSNLQVYKEAVSLAVKSLRFWLALESLLLFLDLRTFLFLTNKSTSSQS